LSIIILYHVAAPSIQVDVLSPAPVAHSGKGAQNPLCLFRPPFGRTRRGTGPRLREAPPGLPTPAGFPLGLQSALAKKDGPMATQWA